MNSHYQGDGRNDATDEVRAVYRLAVLNTRVYDEPPPHGELKHARNEHIQKQYYRFNPSLRIEQAFLTSVPATMEASVFLFSLIHSLTGSQHSQSHRTLSRHPLITKVVLVELC